MSVNGILKVIYRFLSYLYLFHSFTNKEAFNNLVSLNGGFHWVRRFSITTNGDTVHLKGIQFYIVGVVETIYILVSRT